MEITTFYNQGGPGLEISLGVDHSQALVEAVAQRVLLLCEQDRTQEISPLDEDIINCSPGVGIELAITEPDSLIGDLVDFHASTGAALDAIIDERHNSKLKHKWKIEARERLRMGRTALSMADIFRAVQTAQDGDIVDEIEALGAYKGPHPDAGTGRRPFRPCRSNQLQGTQPVCEYVWRRQRRTRHLH